MKLRRLVIWMLFSIIVNCVKTFSLLWATLRKRLGCTLLVKEDSIKCLCNIQQFLSWTLHLSNCRNIPLHLYAMLYWTGSFRHQPMNHVECAIMLQWCLPLCNVADTELNLINMLLQKQIPPTLAQGKSSDHKVFKGTCCTDRD